jgi:hypothetical protein
MEDGSGNKKWKEKGSGDCDRRRGEEKIYLAKVFQVQKFADTGVRKIISVFDKVETWMFEGWYKPEIKGFVPIMHQIGTSFS